MRRLPLSQHQAIEVQPRVRPGDHVPPAGVERHRVDPVPAFRLPRHAQLRQRPPELSPALPVQNDLLAVVVFLGSRLVLRNDPEEDLSAVRHVRVQPQTQVSVTGPVARDGLVVVHDGGGPRVGPQTRRVTVLDLLFAALQPFPELHVPLEVADHLFVARRLLPQPEVVQLEHGAGNGLQLVPFFAAQLEAVDSVPANRLSDRQELTPEVVGELLPPGPVHEEVAMVVVDPVGVLILRGQPDHDPRVRRLEGMAPEAEPVAVGPVAGDCLQRQEAAARPSVPPKGRPPRLRQRGVQLRGALPQQHPALEVVEDEGVVFCRRTGQRLQTTQTERANNGARPSRTP